MKTYPYVIEKYTTPVVTLQDAREWLRMDIPGYTAEDAEILKIIAESVNRAEEYCNIQLGASLYEYITDCYPRVLPDVHHVKELVSIEARQPDGTYLALPSTSYELLRTSKRGHLIEYTVTPTPTSRVRVRFRAGLTPVPEQLLGAIRTMISDRFDNRTDNVAEKKTFSERLLDTFAIPYAG